MGRNRVPVVLRPWPWSGMSSVTLPVTRPAGRALVVGSASCRSQPLTVLKRLGFGCTEAEDPYAAMAEVCRRPTAFRAIILSLQSLFREELQAIAAIKSRFPQVEVWLTDIDGRQAALAEAMRLGADGLIGEDGLHRLGLTASAQPAPSPAAAPVSSGKSLGTVPNLAVGPPSDVERAKSLKAAAPEKASARAASAPSAGSNSVASPAPARRPDRREPQPHPDDGILAEAVLTADELRALLQEPSAPPYAADR